jgi:lysine 2,3-aminomutase
MSTFPIEPERQVVPLRPKEFAVPQEPTSPSRAITMNFLEGTRVLSVDELRDNNITRYQVTKFYQEQIRKSGHYEQLKHIVEPSVREFESPGVLDTSGEHDNTVVPGLQHKYPQTGLLLVTDRCAAYCRYCFRKRLVGNDSDEIAPDYARVATYIGAHPEMHNVLLSGGDSFVLSTEKLHRIMDHLLPLPNLTSIRFGTKTIAFYPPRFADPELPAFFERILAAGKTPVIITHFDHLGEISEEALRNIDKLRACGVQFMNQMVLLNHVNNEPDIIAQTFSNLHDAGVRPYYLFQGRPVKAGSHFQVSLREGVEIVRGVNARLNGIHKTFKYIMSHVTGKIEILDLDSDNRLYMRYHQNKYANKIGKIFSRRYVEGACWLDDLPSD